MADPSAVVASGYDWTTLLLVGLPGTIMGAVTLAVVLLDRAKGQGSRDGQEAADIKSLESRVEGLDKTSGGLSNALQQHLIDCGRNQGRIEQVLVSLKEGLEKHERTTAGLQRSIANWMRDKEQGSKVAGGGN